MVQDQKRQRVIRIVTMPCQQTSTLFTLHGKQSKWRFAGMLLEPACTATTEVAETIEYDDPIFCFHILSLRHFSRLHTQDQQGLGHPDVQGFGAIRSRPPP